MTTYIRRENRESGRAFVARAIQGEVVMLNLLRFREVADYSATPDLAPGRRSATLKPMTDILPIPFPISRKVVANCCSSERVEPF